MTQNASLPAEGVRGLTNGVMVEMRDPKEAEKNNTPGRRERTIHDWLLFTFLAQCGSIVWLVAVVTVVLGMDTRFMQLITTQQATNATARA